MPRKSDTSYSQGDNQSSEGQVSVRLPSDMGFPSASSPISLDPIQQLTSSTQQEASEKLAVLVTRFKAIESAGLFFQAYQQFSQADGLVQKRADLVGQLRDGIGIKDRSMRLQVQEEYASSTKKLEGIVAEFTHSTALVPAFAYTAAETGQA